MNTKFLKSGDIDATLGIFFDGFTKIIPGIAILSVYGGLPKDIIYGNMLPGLGLSMFLLLSFNTIYAIKLSKKHNNPNMTAMPGGISAATFFVWLFGIIMPSYYRTGDIILAYSIGANANLIYSIIMLLCAFIIRKLFRAIRVQAMFGGLLGGSIAFLLITAFTDGYAYPQVIIPALFILISFYYGDIRIKYLSPSLVAIAVGTVIAWSTKQMDYSNVVEALSNTGIYIPKVSFLFIGGEAFKLALDFLPLIIAFVFYDITAVMQSIEQAAQSDENFDPKISLIAIGGINLFSSFLGSIFPSIYYWGHPAWKKINAGVSYPFISGTLFLTLSITGLSAFVAFLIPVSATVIFAIYAAIVAGSQAFTSTDKKYYPVIIFSSAFPIIELTTGKITSAVTAIEDTFKNNIESMTYTMSNVPEILKSYGISKGFFDLSKGSMMISIIYASIFIEIIDKRWKRVSVFFLVAAISSLFGLIHSSSESILNFSIYFYTYLAMSLLGITVHVFTQTNNSTHN